MDQELVEIADLLHDILHMAYVKERQFFTAEAKARGISKESLIAAAICEMIRTRLDDPSCTAKIFSHGLNTDRTRIRTDPINGPSYWARPASQATQARGARTPLTIPTASEDRAWAEALDRSAPR